MGQQFRKLRDSQEKNSALAAVIRGSAKVKSEILNDPNIWEQQDKIEDKYKELISESASRIHSSEARSQFVQRANIELAYDQAHLNMLIKNKQSQLYKGTVTDVVSAYAEKYETALPQEQSQIKEAMKISIDEAIQRGGIDASAARTHLEKTLESLGARTLLSDLRLAESGPNSKQAVDQIEKEMNDPKGRYRDIPNFQKSYLFLYKKSVPFLYILCF